MNSFVFRSFFINAVFILGTHGKYSGYWHQGSLPLDYNDKGEFICKHHFKGSAFYGITASSRFPDDPKNDDWCRFFWTCPENDASGTPGLRHGCKPYMVYDPSHEQCVKYTNWFNEPKWQRAYVFDKPQPLNLTTYKESVGNCYKSALRRDFHLQHWVSRYKRSDNEMADPKKAMEVDSDHEDIDDEEVDGVVGKSTMADELLNNQAMFAALQGKLNSMVGLNSGYISETDREESPMRKVRKSSPVPKPTASKPKQQKFIEPIEIEPEDVKEVVNIKNDPEVVMASTLAGKDFGGDKYDESYDGYYEDDGAEMGDGAEGTGFDDASEDHILNRMVTPRMAIAPLPTTPLPPTTLATTPLPTTPLPPTTLATTPLPTTPTPVVTLEAPPTTATTSEAGP